MTHFRIRTLLLLFIPGALLFTGCGSDETTGVQAPQVSAIVISPDSTSLEVGEQMEFSALLLTAAGDTVDRADADIDWEWWSDDPEVFTVQPGGIATGQAPGEAHCIVEAAVEVSGDLPTPDKLIIAGFGPTGESRINLELSPRAGEISPAEKISAATRLRFTGRDSAFVMVF